MEHGDGVSASPGAIRLGGGGFFMVQNVDRLRGSVCPVVTPFNERDEVDEGKLRELIDWQLDNGTHGISVTGTTGDPSSLTL
ncbi:MAG: dihydrodipicolinate synthase family protein, partial [Planifilum sp.]